MPTYELRLADGTPADPPTVSVNAPMWKVGDVIPLGAGRALRVVGTVATESVLIVEPAHSDTPAAR